MKELKGETCCKDYSGDFDGYYVIWESTVSSQQVLYLRGITPVVLLKADCFKYTKVRGLFHESREEAAMTLGALEAVRILICPTGRKNHLDFPERDLSMLNMLRLQLCRLST